MAVSALTPYINAWYLNLLNAKQVEASHCDTYCSLLRVIWSFRMAEL